MPATYEPLATTTVSGSSTTEIIFSSISGSYTDLVLIGSGFTSADVQTYIQFNSDTGSNYSDTYIYGDGTNAVSGRDISQQSIFAGGYATSASGNKIAHILNYSNSTTNKTVLIRANNPVVGYTQARVGLWRSTAAITSIRHFVTSGVFSSGFTLTLYGIKAA